MFFFFFFLREGFLYCSLVSCLFFFCIRVTAVNECPDLIEFDWSLASICDYYLAIDVNQPPAASDIHTIKILATTTTQHNDNTDSHSREYTSAKYPNRIELNRLKRNRTGRRKPRKKREKNKRTKRNKALNRIRSHLVHAAPSITSMPQAARWAGTPSIRGRTESMRMALLTFCLVGLQCVLPNLSRVPSVLI